MPTTNSDSAWRVKLGRAEEHIAALNHLLDEYRAQDPYSVRPEATADPNRTDYRLQINQAVPSTLSSIVGDALHNLRSSLDSLVCALIERSAAIPLSEAEVHAISFPLSETPAKFDRFLDDPRRKTLYYPELRRTLRELQPFHSAEQLQVDGWTEPELQAQYAVEYETFELHRLFRLNNIDKHRRLAVAVWWPEMLWWGSNGATKRKYIPGEGTHQDGSILWSIEGHDEGAGDIMHSFALVLIDDSAHDPSRRGYSPIDCKDLLYSMRGAVTSGVTSLEQLLGNPLT